MHATYLKKFLSDLRKNPEEPIALDSIWLTYELAGRLNSVLWIYSRVEFEEKWSKPSHFDQMVQNTVKVCKEEKKNLWRRDLGDSQKENQA